MIIKNAAEISNTDILKFSWSGLRRFHHTPSVEKVLVAINGYSQEHKGNFRKQAKQIRQCLMQAKEYRDAANVTSLATRPLLLYYSAMSLALAQILFKGSELDSLDKARGEHAHHGLNFVMRDTKRQNFDLETAAEAFVAKPMLNSGQRQGTFELWHRSARDLPLTGELENTVENWSRPTQAFFIPADKRFELLPKKGVILMDCFAASPGMLEWLHNHGARYDTVRAEISGKIWQPNTDTFDLLVHPHRYPKIVERIKAAIAMPAGAVDRITAHEFAVGFALNFTATVEDPIDLKVPSGAMWTTKEVRFLPTEGILNEFGYLYAGLFILGNLARYYPDLWMDEVDQGSPLIQATEHFLDMAEWRIAQLTLSELSLINYVAAA